MARKRRRRRKKTVWRKFRRWVIALIALPVIVSVLLVLPLRWLSPITSAFMLRGDQPPIQYESVDWSSINSNVPLAVVAAEDQRFAQHFGIDLNAVRQSIDEANSGERLRGASTITQQLAKNLYLSSERSFFRKGIEAWFALWLEACLPKQRILELYVNVVEFGPGIYGIGAASQQHFGKSPAAITAHEAALLAAVLPNPIRMQVRDPSPYVRKRQAWILEQLQRLKREQWLTLIE